MLGYLFGRQAEKPRNIVVKNIPRLFRGQKVRPLDGLDSHADRVWPGHLIRPEHNSLRKAVLIGPPAVSMIVAWGKPSAALLLAGFFRA
jgi:hypothetical protein